MFLMSAHTVLLTPGCLGGCDEGYMTLPDLLCVLTTVVAWTSADKRRCGHDLLAATDAPAPTMDARAAAAARKSRKSGGCSPPSGAALAASELPRLARGHVA